MEVGEGSRKKKSKEVFLNLNKKSEKKSGGALVGRLLTGKNLNKPTVVSMIKKGWQLDKEIEVHDLDRNKLIFLFRFENVEDYHRIIKGRPWSIQGHMLSIQVWEDYMVLDEVDFNTSPFWVQFHGLPLEAFDNENAVTLGNAVGETMMYEKPEVDGKLTRGFIRVRSLINLKNPLVVGFWVPRQDKDPAWVRVQYERLQNFCYKCGRIGHEARGCREGGGKDEDEESNGDFGNWVGTPHVKTLDNFLEICKEDWLEAKIYGNRRSTAGKSLKVKCLLTQDNFGKNQSSASITQECIITGENFNATYGENSKSVIDDLKGGKEDLMDIMTMRDPRIEPNLVSPEVSKREEVVRRHVTIIRNDLAGPRVRIQEVHHMPSQKGVEGNNVSHIVEFPKEAEDCSRAIIPFSGLSPISAMTNGLKDISLQKKFRK